MNPLNFVPGLSVVTEIQDTAEQAKNEQSMLGKALLGSFLGSITGSNRQIVDTSLTPPETDEINYTPVYIIGGLAILAVVLIIVQTQKR